MNLKYDNEIAIATGRSRKETHWRNREMHWSAFVEKLSGTHRTPETWAEYVKAEKSRQDEIKDIGGFVGGMLTGGRRKSGSVASRSLVTLDIDNGDAFVWDDFTLLYTNAAVVYSTHKHTPDKPRLRLVIPLDRPVTPEEYVPIARRIAGLLGINRFDDTTFEPERLMYWPSTPKDVEYYFRYQDGPFISADEVLNTYRDWRDASEWPVSERQGEAIRREIKKQADPLEKPGIVGVFCRTYGIGKAIETFLPDVYEACDVDNRYTYKEGSTAAGLIVYDDKFAYSHHGTDPVSGMLCNAFDLVRIHLFGLRDENVKTNGTRADRYPSYLAMEDFACKDTEVKRTLFAEKADSIKEDFGDVNLMDDDNAEWKDSLDCDKNGNCLKSRKNLVLILKNDPNLKECFAVDTFSNRAALRKIPLWREKGDDDMFLRDDDVMNLRNYLETVWGIDSKDKINDALGVVSRTNAFNPVKEYLEKLTWDGEKRAETFFIDYLGVEDRELFRECTKTALAACVARALNSVVEFDNMVVLVGAQGTGKSKILAKLAKNRRWFSDSIDIKGKEAYEGVRGKWIIEIAELAGFRKQDSETIKRFLTAPSDFYRAAFERYPQDQVRRCVFFGTTNDLSFLRDPTGARRFWPMEVNPSRRTKDQWTDLTPETVNQVWAEAMQLYKSGQNLHLPPHLEKEMDILRGTYTEEDDRRGIIQNYLNTLLPVDWGNMSIERRREYFENGDPLQSIGTVPREFVCVAEIWCECLSGQRSNLTRSISREIMNIMRSIEGWEYVATTKTIKPYDRQKYFKRTEPVLENKTDNAQKVGCIF